MNEYKQIAHFAFDLGWDASDLRERVEQVAVEMENIEDRARGAPDTSDDDAYERAKDKRDEADSLAGIVNRS
jgi:hypothetical protein